MADPAHVAEEFLDCWTTKDFERARTLLKDDLHFEGPIDTFDDADSYLNALRGLTQMMTGLEKLKVFVDGDDACIIYDLKTAPVPTARTAEWYRVSDGKISWVTVVFDARPFAALSEAQGN
jgi:hypothetical protein